MLQIPNYLEPCFISKKKELGKLSKALRVASPKPFAKWGRRSGALLARSLRHFHMFQKLWYSMVWYDPLKKKAEIMLMLLLLLLLFSRSYSLKTSSWCSWSPAGYDCLILPVHVTFAAAGCSLVHIQGAHRPPEAVDQHGFPFQPARPFGWLPLGWAFDKQKLFHCSTWCLRATYACVINYMK